MKKFTSTIILVSLFLCASFLASCSIFKKSEVEKAEVEQQDLDVAADVELRKREKAHYQIQSREAKKMMKRTKRMSKKLNRNRMQPD